MKKTLILVVVLFVLTTLFVVIGNIILIGDKITQIVGVPYLEYAFYLFLITILSYLIYGAILQPMIRIHNTPEFPILSVEDQENGMTDEEYRKRLISFAHQLCDNCYYLPISKRASYQANLKNELTLINNGQNITQLKDFLTKELNVRYKNINKLILAYGTKVFIITAISSSNKFDSLATIGLNYRMVSDIVRSSGFRPNKLQLIKLYYLVISSAFFSYFFQGVSESVGDVVDDLSQSDLDIDISDAEIPDIDPSNIDFTQYVKNLNAPYIPLAPLADGLANSIMTISIGHIAKYYLQKGAKELKGAKGRKVKMQAKIQALKQIPLLLVEIPSQINNTGLSLIMKGFEKAYNKMSKNKYTPHEDDFLDDMDKYGFDNEYTEEKPQQKKKGLFNFWK